MPTNIAIESVRGEGAQVLWEVLYRTSHKEFLQQHGQYCDLYRFTGDHLEKGKMVNKQCCPKNIRPRGERGPVSAHQVQSRKDF